ncbi:MAG: cytochrome c [Burkholderiales bacterium]|nr:cytochrome c [Burkholderiales bacterium]
MKLPFIRSSVIALAIALPCVAADDIPPPDKTAGVDLQSPEVIAKGMEILNTTCGGYCHGTGGGGLKAPRLRNRDDLSPDSLHATISFGRKRGGKVMPPWKGTLSEQEIWTVIAAIVALRTAEPIAGGGAQSSNH